MQISMVRQIQFLQTIYITMATGSKVVKMLCGFAM